LKERKYFDSGDYALSKAGKADSVDAGTVGSEHPVPENIPHLSSPVNNSGLLNAAKHHSAIPGVQAGSPVKESSFLNRETSAEELEDQEKEKENKSPAGNVIGGEALPIRR
jgi:hypothetical protein